MGMDRIIQKAEIVRAALESIAYQVTDIISAIKEECVERKYIGWKRAIKATIFEE